MPIIAATGKQRRKVRFSNNRQVSAPATSSTISNTNSNHLLQATGSKAAAPAAYPRSRTVVAPTTGPSVSTTMATTTDRPGVGVPALFSEPPAIRDPLTTETTHLQDETVAKCLPYLQGSKPTQKGPFNPHAVPALQRDDHVAFLYDALEDYPASFVALDASRPWMVYWSLAGLSLLGEDVSHFRDRYDHLTCHHHHPPVSLFRVVRGLSGEKF